MATALYRRYRPDTFADLIGQDQVTGPLVTALRTDRVNHAYLFSGPRGCGKTTSARILARCLNCEQGPTPEPCGVCASCVELATGGPGSLDVVEIDAASHNGVDDARDLRERAAFAPARDRFKIFILDEAHMVTQQGFNAMLKLVEEPPEHVKFIFATTEPDKVIGTIRSRTHHYPFRLVPPAVMLPYLEKILGAEGVAAEPGVLPLVIRAGGGSVRDTLSILDQVIAGSDTGTISYQRTVSLLGFTPADLLDQIIEAVSRPDATRLFLGVDQVIQTGQDPRRFAKDLLERFRDLIVVTATGEASGRVLRGATDDELANLSRQAQLFGPAQLARCAAVVSQGINEMTGVTNPQILLEVMAARLILPEGDHSADGTMARLDRLERRVGVDQGATPATHPAAEPPRATPEVQAEVAPEPAQQRPVSPVSSESSVPSQTQPAPARQAPSSAGQPAQPAKPSGPVTLDQVRAAWPEILDRLSARSKMAWIVVSNASAIALEHDVLTLSFVSRADADAFRSPKSSLKAPEALRQVILEVLGLHVKYLAKVGAPAAKPTQGPQAAQEAPRSPRRAPSERPSAPEHRPQAPREPEPVHPPEPEYVPEYDLPPEPPEPEPWPEGPAIPEDRGAAPRSPAAQPAPTPEPHAGAELPTERKKPPTAQYGEPVIRERLRAVPIDDPDEGAR